MELDTKNQPLIDTLSSDGDDDLADDAQLQALLAQAKASLPPSTNPRPHRLKLPQIGSSSSLPKPYFKGSGKKDIPPTLDRDPDVEEVDTKIVAAPNPPSGPPTDSKGRLLTRREQKEMKNTTAGPDWFDLPAPRPHELPELYKQVEALRLRRAMDPKMHAKADPAEKKGIKGLPKFFAIGKVIDTPTPFKTRSTANLTRKERKDTLVDELVADSNARSFAKRKFSEIAASKRVKYQEKAFKRSRKW
ncbi:hypothetical protein FRC04_005761 [Tulasnella sp. 424]|nr:hypothetical protein FRC04_005761 [Tulasnella sp. 424]KAG8977546.1 hypothetical protein FRC05_001404 [Tulasnella sp. 425]